jgi:Flavodoxin domain
MSALVVFESVYGNTRAVAEAVAEGLQPLGDVRISPVHEAASALVEDADVLVVGGPTHMHGLATSQSRRLAIQAGEEDGVEVEAGAREEPGLRRWLSERSGRGAKAASFDTRLDRSPLLTGVAARGIARRLRRRGYELIGDPESFLVEDSEGPLVEGELGRARAWGAHLAGTLAAQDAQ